MMTWVVMFFALIAGTVLQSAMPGFAFMGQAKLPVLLAVFLYYALTRETHVMLVSAFLAGLMQDLLSPIPLGSSVAFFCVIGWITGLFRRVVLAESPVTQVFFGGVTGGAMAACLWGILSRSGVVHYPPGRAAVKVACTAVLAALCTPLVFKVGERLDRVVGNVEARESIDEIEGVQY